LAYVKDGAVAATAFEGYQDLQTKRPIDDETIFHWASITKTFTGVAIMQLRDRGLLSLDDPAIKYVPELREVHNPYGDMSQVTVRHLMSHSAGFRAATWPWGGDQPWHPFEPTRWGQVVAMFPYTELLFRPGPSYRYSNGGLNPPLGDMAKWLAFLIGSSPDPGTREGWNRLLKRSSLEEMFTPQIRAAGGEGGSGTDVQAGLSCFIEQHQGMELVGHSGDQNGFISHLYFHRPSKSGYIVSFNTDVTSQKDARITTRAVDDDVRDAIARELLREVAF